VQDEHVAGFHRVGTEELDRLLHAVVVRTGEDRDARGVGDHVSGGVVDPDSVVVDLVDHGVVRGAAQVAGGFLGGGQQAVPNDLDGDRVAQRRPSPSCWSVMTSSPYRPTASRSPPCSTVVAVCSVMTAGPGTTSPARRDSRAYNAYSRTTPSVP